MTTPRKACCFCGDSDPVSWEQELFAAGFPYYIEERASFVVFTNNRWGFLPASGKGSKLLFEEMNILKFR